MNKVQFFRQTRDLIQEKMIFLKDLVEIEMITTNTKMRNYITEAPDSVRLWLKIGIFVFYLLSIFSLIAHVFKFFQSKTKQHLVTKNLTLYCFLMLMVYLWIPTEILFVERLKIIKKTYYSLITFYLLLMPAFIKLIIAIDVCLCFREPVLYMNSRPSPQNKKFTIYCIITGSIPLGILSTAYLLKGFECVVYSYDATKTIIRIIRIVPICAAFWYIRRSSFNKKEFYKKYSLHIRLLVLIGAVPSALVLAQWIFQPNLLCASDDFDFKKFNIKDLVLTILIQLRFLLDGFAVGIWFTFRKGAFQSVNEKQLKVQESHSRKSFEESVKLNNLEQNCSENTTSVV